MSQRIAGGLFVETANAAASRLVGGSVPVGDKPVFSGRGYFAGVTRLNGIIKGRLRVRVIDDKTGVCVAQSASEMDGTFMLRRFDERRQFVLWSECPGEKPLITEPLLPKV